MTLLPLASLAQQYSFRFLESLQYKIHTNSFLIHYVQGLNKFWHALLCDERCFPVKSLVKVLSQSGMHIVVYINVSFVILRSFWTV